MSDIGPKQQEATDLADTISGLLGWQGAQPEPTGFGGYTGNVSLTARAATAVAEGLGKELALRVLKRRLKGDIEQLYHEAETVIQRYRADKRAKADALAEVLGMLP